MACTNCKKKKLDTDSMKKNRKPIIDMDRSITWVLVGWFFLGLYGLISLSVTLFKFIF